MAQVTVSLRQLVLRRRPTSTPNMAEHLTSAPAYCVIGLTIWRNRYTSTQTRRDTRSATLLPASLLPDVTSVRGPSNRPPHPPSPNLNKIARLVTGNAKGA